MLADCGLFVGMFLAALAVFYVAESCERPRLAKGEMDHERKHDLG